MALTRVVRALSATAMSSTLILVAAPTVSADQTRRDQWALEALQAESAWQLSKGEGITVAVIDDGVNAAHQDLVGNVLPGKDFWDGDDDASPAGEDDHGTAMASLIAGHGHGTNSGDGVMGLAPKAKILPVRWDYEGEGGFADEIRYAVDHGASIINISVSSSRDLPEDRQAVSYALKHDVLIVTASGNEGRGDVVDYPKKYAGVLTVGGVDQSGVIWEKSSFGPEVLLTAPATRLVSASSPGDALRIGTGTSDAAALVSAAAALVRSRFPTLTAGQVANRLVETAVLPDSAQGIALPDEKYGYGVIRPLAALAEEIPAGSKLGPLETPESQGASAASGVGKSESDYAAEKEQADQKRLLVFAVLGLIGLVVIGLIVWLVVRSSRRNKSGPGGPASSGGYPSYGQQTAPQQYPYQQQSPPPSQGQWP